jgi:dGTPase
LLTELVLALADRGAPVLDPMFASSYEQAAGDAEKLRVVLDQVSLLTDAQAVTRHRRLVG